MFLNISSDKLFLNISSGKSSLNISSDKVFLDISSGNLFLNVSSDKSCIERPYPLSASDTLSGPVLGGADIINTIFLPITSAGAWFPFL